ncbi:MAG: class I SAM-dependent methyltransferase [Solobacterium sp.]|nr:class I SAM-dependent methyltransferase [Solobacterium sp.]
MLDSKGFDLWADRYDESVSSSDEKDTYPFAGYRKVLNTIYNEVMSKPHAKVLDLGFGTGILTKALYDQGCEIYGIDFSEKMVERAQAKMPGAHLFKADFSQGLSGQPALETYDFIIATYSMHHLSDPEKITLLKELHEHLNSGGKILIGDIAFETRGKMIECKTAAGSEWDEDEIYVVYDELKAFFPDLTFEKISHCAAVLTLPSETH